MNISYEELMRQQAAIERAANPDHTIMDSDAINYDEEEDRKQRVRAYAKRATHSPYKIGGQVSAIRSDWVKNK